VAGPAAGPGSISGSTDGGDEQALAVVSNAARTASSKNVRPVAPWASAWPHRSSRPLAMPVCVSRPVPAGTEHAEHLVEVGGLEDRVSTVVPERLAQDTRTRTAGASTSPRRWSGSRGRTRTTGTTPPHAIDGVKRASRWVSSVRPGAMPSTGTARLADRSTHSKSAEGGGALHEPHLPHSPPAPTALRRRALPRLNSFGPPGTPEWSRSTTVGPWRSSPASHTPPTPACRPTVRRCPRLRRPTRVAHTSE
jgi:hypothetical protein